MNNQQANKIAKTFGIILTVHGFKMTRSGYDGLSRVKLPSRLINDSFDRIKKMPVSQRDFAYYFTGWDNWEGMLETVHKIIKDFKWEKEVFDCDDRSKMVSALCSLLFRVNTCAEVYCEITSLKTGNKDYHWTNVVITSSGELYLFDVDNGGLFLKLYPNKPITMGKWSYNFIRVRL